MNHEELAEAFYLALKDVEGDIELKVDHGPNKRPWKKIQQLMLDFERTEVRRMVKEPKVSKKWVGKCGST